jgi:predicted DsbA family dithiol-disulfide isomerase
MNRERILRLYFDYIDPASFLLEHRLRQMEGAETFSLALEPLELSPPPADLLDPNGEEWSRHWETMAKEAEELGLTLRRPWIVPWSRKAHELALFAEEQDCLQGIHQTLFRAYLLEGVDIGRVDVLVDLARQQGLDPLEVKTALDIDLYRESVIRKRAAALEAGVARSPTLVLNENRLEGYPDKETLESFLTERTRT